MKEKDLKVYCKIQECWNVRYRLQPICASHHTEEVMARYHTLRGYLRCKYISIRSRCLGTHPSQSKVYIGLPFMSKEDFMKYEYDKTVIKLWNAFEKSGFNRQLAPSPDRINPKDGYTEANIEWMTNGENRAFADLTRKMSRTKARQHILAKKKGGLK